MKHSVFYYIERKELRDCNKIYIRFRTRRDYTDTDTDIDKCPLLILTNQCEDETFLMLPSYLEPSTECYILRNVSGEVSYTEGGTQAIWIDFGAIRD